MVREIWIYIEGGGRNGTEGATALRRGFAGFFAELMSTAEQNNIIWRNVPSGGRRQAYTDFVTEREDSPEGVLHFLLVDSEGPVDADCPHWKYLHERKEDQWELCEDDEKYLHLMVQAMEA